MNVPERSRQIDTEGCNVEILRNLNVERTRADFREHHSRADADTVKALLAHAFDLIGVDAGGALGTFSFI